MKIIKTLTSAFIVLSYFAIQGVPLSSCTKTNTVHDTTTVTIHDTTSLTVRDTVTVKDTVTIIGDPGDLSDGLVAYYNFNGGNLNDSSGHGNNIVFNNATPTEDRFGNPESAYLFDGRSSYMTVKNSASINPNKISIYAIIKVYGFNQDGCHGNQILSKGYPYNVNGFYALSFYPYNNSVGGVCNPNADTTKEFFAGGFGDNIPLGVAAGSWGNSSADSVYVQKYQWYTLVFTYDGTTSKFYVNGALARTTVNTGTVTFTPNSNDLFIGKHENPLYPYYFNGVIDEIRIYNKVITNRQVQYMRIFKDKYLRVNNKLIH